MRPARLFPFLETIRNYSAQDFKADMTAALTVTPMAVPQAMAYAIIAGVHPQYGIYACMLPVSTTFSPENIPLSFFASACFIRTPSSNS